MSPAQQEPRQHPPPSGPSADQHLQILGILTGIFGGLLLLGGLGMGIMMGLFGYAMGLEPGNDVPRAFLGAIFGVMAFIFAALGVFYLVTGVGLWRHRSWSRIAGFIASALALLNVPIGTAYGIYGFYVLTRPEVVERLEGEYRVSPAAPDPGPSSASQEAAHGPSDRHGEGQALAGDGPE